MANELSDNQQFIERSYSVVKIEGNDEQKTLYFKVGQHTVLPGQFYMLNYRLRQKPFSVSHYDGELIGFTIQERGEVSSLMIKAAGNDYFGLNGPLGNPFMIAPYRHFLIIGGGIGIAPLYFLANYLIKNGKKATVLFGGRSQNYLDFSLDLKKFFGDDYKIYTEDGSVGEKGLVTRDLEAVLSSQTFDTACICGPEKMLAYVIANISKSISHIQVCMERYMKCGIGLCGSCVIDDIGERVCQEGPVFIYESSLKKSRELGHYHRNSCGIIEKF